MRDFPEWMPEVSQRRARAMGFKSVREIERKAGIANAKLKTLHTGDMATLRNLVAYLRAIGYSCQSPEFDVVNEICSQNVDSNRSACATISSSTNETRNLKVLDKEMKFVDVKSLNKRAA